MSYVQLKASERIGSGVFADVFASGDGDVAYKVFARQLGMRDRPQLDIDDRNERVERLRTFYRGSKMSGGNRAPRILFRWSCDRRLSNSGTGYHHRRVHVARFRHGTPILKSSS